MHKLSLITLSALLFAGAAASGCSSDSSAGEGAPGTITPGSGDSGAGGQAGSGQAGAGQAGTSHAGQAGAGARAGAGSGQAGTAGKAGAGAGGQGGSAAGGATAGGAGGSPAAGAAGTGAGGSGAAAGSAGLTCGDRGGKCVTTDVPPNQVCPGGMVSEDPSCPSSQVPGGGMGCCIPGGAAGAGGSAGSAGAGAAGSGGGSFCGGIAGIQCAPTEYCDFPDGDITCGGDDSSGACKPRPVDCGDGCPAPEFWVCACDGQKYCNACAAAQAGVDTIPCGGAGGAGGGAGQGGAGGDSGAAGAGGSTGLSCADLGGMCVTTDVPPNTVCPNGMIVANDSCPSNPQPGGGMGCCIPGSTPTTCGGKTGKSCAADEFCDYADNALCGGFDSTGVCQPKPTDCGVGCPAPDFQVCGCDGNKYCSDCEAHKAGVDVTPCPGSGKACGGFAGMTCAADEYCDFPQDSCGATDESGTCKPKPISCDASCNLIALCGCDGNKYCNECAAAEAGVDVTPCAGTGASGSSCSMDNECGSGLKCCYPCGIPGCTNQCMAPDANGQCPNLP